MVSREICRLWNWFNECATLRYWYYRFYFCVMGCYLLFIISHHPNECLWARATCVYTYVDYWWSINKILSVMNFWIWRIFDLWLKHLIVNNNCIVWNELGTLQLRSNRMIRGGSRNFRDRFPGMAWKLRAKPESRAQPETRTGGGVWGGGSVSPSFPENFCKIDSEMVQSANFTSKLSDQANSLICPCFSNLHTNLYIYISTTSTVQGTEAESRYRGRIQLGLYCWRGCQIPASLP